MPRASQRCCTGFRQGRAVCRAGMAPHQAGAGRRLRPGGVGAPSQTGPAPAGRSAANGRPPWSGVTWRQRGAPGAGPWGKCAAPGGPWGREAPRCGGGRVQAAGAGWACSVTRTPGQTLGWGCCQVCVRTPVGLAWREHLHLRIQAGPLQSSLEPREATGQRELGTAPRACDCVRFTHPGPCPAPVLPTVRQEFASPLIFPWVS